MYFIIESIGEPKYSEMGLINIDASFYLEEGDIGYDKFVKEHHVQVPVIPEEGYLRQLELDSSRNIWKEIEKRIHESTKEGTVYAEDYPEYVTYQNELKLYLDWIESLPKKLQVNPFCTHSIQFEHDVTEEEILWCFEWALGITQWNYLMDDLHCQKKDEKGNPYSQVVNQPFHYSARKEYFKVISQLPLGTRSDYMNSELAKVAKVESRLDKIQKIDFSKVKTVGKYKVK